MKPFKKLTITTVVFFAGAGLIFLFAGRPAAAEPESTDEPPRVNSPWRSYDFSVDRVQVRQALWEIMEEEGLTVVEESDQKGTFKTDIIDFESGKFGEDLALPPPRASMKYPFFQFNVMNEGHFGLEGQIRQRTDGSTRLQLRAILEIRALDKKSNEWAYVPRISNGMVETNFFGRISKKLHPLPESHNP